MSLGKVWGSASVRRLQQRPAAFDDVREELLLDISSKQDECSTHSSAGLRGYFVSGDDESKQVADAQFLEVVSATVGVFLNERIVGWPRNLMSASDEGYMKSAMCCCQDSHQSDEKIGVDKATECPIEEHGALSGLFREKLNEHEHKLLHGTAMHKIHFGRAAELVNYYVLVDRPQSESFQENQAKTMLSSEIDKENKKAWGGRIWAGELSRDSNAVFAKTCDEKHLVIIIGRDHMSAVVGTILWKAELLGVARKPPKAGIFVMSARALEGGEWMLALRSRIEEQVPAQHRKQGAAKDIQEAKVDVQEAPAVWRPQAKLEAEDGELEAEGTDEIWSTDGRDEACGSFQHGGRSDAAKVKAGLQAPRTSTEASTTHATTEMPSTTSTEGIHSWPRLGPVKDDIKERQRLCSGVRDCSHFNLFTTNQSCQLFSRKETLYYETAGIDVISGRPYRNTFAEDLAKGCPNLKEINLWKTSVRDAGVKECKCLRDLTKATEGGASAEEIDTREAKHWEATYIQYHDIFARMCDGRTIPLRGLTRDSAVEDAFRLLDKYFQRSHYRIAFAGCPVIKGTLKEYGIQKGSTIDMMPRLRGGMPHFHREDEKYLGSTSASSLLRLAKMPDPVVPVPVQAIQTLHGVSVAIVCDNMLAVMLDASSIFDASSEEMLQVALSSFEEVDELVDYLPEDRDTYDSCVKCGFEAISDFSYVTLRENGLKAVGVSGRESSLFALVLELVRENEDSRNALLSHLGEFCWAHADAFRKILKFCEPALPSVEQTSPLTSVVESSSREHRNKNQSWSADISSDVSSSCASNEPAPEDFPEEDPPQEHLPRNVPPVGKPQPPPPSAPKKAPPPPGHGTAMMPNRYIPAPPPSAPKKAPPPPGHGTAMMPNGCIPAASRPPPPPPRKGIDHAWVTPRVETVQPWQFDDDDDPPVPAARQTKCQPGVASASRVQPWLVDETTPPASNAMPDVMRVGRLISNPAALPYALRMASAEKLKLQQLNEHGGVQQVQAGCHIQKVSPWNMDEDPPQNGLSAKVRQKEIATDSNTQAAQKLVAGRALADLQQLQTPAPTEQGGFSALVDSHRLQTPAPTEGASAWNFLAEPQTQTPQLRGSFQQDRRTDFELKNELALKPGERTPSFSDTASSVSREADSIRAPWKKDMRDQAEFYRNPGAVAPTETISQESDSVWSSWKKDFKAESSGSDAWAGWMKKADAWESSSWDKGWNRSQWTKFFWNEGCKMKMKSLRQTTDDELTSMAAYLTEDYFPQLRQVTPTLPIWFDELNLGGNKLRDSGVKAVLTALIEHGVQLRSVKMHKNLIGSSGADAVVRLINDSPLPPAEVHLSHNLLGPADVRKIIVAAAYRDEYPLRDSRDVRPLWLRIERQQGRQWDSCHDHETRWQRTQEMITFAEKRVIQVRQSLGLLPDPCPVDLGYMLCLPEFNCRCSSRYCLKSHEYGPIIQLPYMWEQGATYAHREYAKERNSGFGASDLPGAGGDGYHAVAVCEPKWMPSFKSDDNLWKASKAARSNSLEKYELELVYESATAMVLNKGPGWVCKWNAFSKLSSKMKGFPRQQHLDKRSWQEMVSSKSWEFFDSYLARRFQDEMACAWWEWQRSPQVGREPAAGAGCVHRLDKDTSGCIVRAKTQASFDELKTQVQRVGFQKHYLCLVHSHVPNGGQRHEITAKIASSPPGGPIQSYIDEESGEWSETRVWCLAHLRSPVGNYSLCEVRILTGRTHQIRVHLEHMGWPLVSDEKYNSLYAWKDSLWCPRIFLHSYTVTFYDASVSDYVDVRSSVPQDLRDALLHLTLERDFTNGHMQKVLSDSWDGHIPDTVLHERQEKDQAYSSWEGYTNTKRDWQSYSDWDKYKPSSKELDWSNYKSADWDNGKNKDWDNGKNKDWDDWDNGKRKDWDAYNTGDWSKYKEHARDASGDETRANELEALEIALESVVKNLLRGGSVEIAKLSKNLDVRVKLRQLQCGGPAAESDAARLQAFLSSRRRIIKVTDGIAELSAENSELSVVETKVCDV